MLVFVITHSRLDRYEDFGADNVMTEGSLGGRAAANSRCLALPEVDLQPLPSLTSPSFPSRANQPMAMRTICSDNFARCLSLLSVVLPCPSRYRQIVPAASPISTSTLQLLYSASACSSQNLMPISRYIVVAVVRCSCACSRLPVRR